MDDLDLELTLDAGKTNAPKKGRRANLNSGGGGPLFGGSPLRARPQTGAEELFLDEGTKAGNS